MVSRELSQSTGGPVPAANHAPEVPAGRPVSRRERERLPTREQIDAITDAGALADIEAKLEETRQHVEVDLEFGSEGDLERERRARGFLTAVRATLVHVRKRLHRVRTNFRVLPDNEAQLRSAEVKAARRLAHEQAEANAKARKQREHEALLIQQAILNRKLAERLSYLHHFHAEARRLLSQDECRAVSNAAYQSLQAAMREALPHPAPETPPPAEASEAPDLNSMEGKA